MASDLGEYIRNLNDSEMYFIRKLTSPIANYVYGKTHKKVEKASEKEDYIAFFKYAFRSSLFFIYFPLFMVGVDVILSQAFSIIYPGSTPLFLNLPLYRMFGFIFLLIVALVRSYDTFIHSASPWALSESESLGLNHGGGLLLYGGVVYTIFSFIKRTPGFVDLVLLFVALTVPITILYSKAIDYQIEAEEFMRFQKDDLQLNGILWNSIKRTLSTTGLFIVVSTGLFDLVATRIFQTGTLTGTKMAAGLFLFCLTFYMYGMAFRVFTYNESISLSFGFFTWNFRNTVIAIFQAVLIFAASCALNLITMFAFSSVGFPEGRLSLIHFLAFIPFLLQLFMSTSLVFTPYYGIMSEGFVSSFKRSWRLAAGNRFGIFFCGAIGLMTGGIIALVLLIPASILFQSYLGELSQYVSSILLHSMFIYPISLFSEIFNSLK